ncbi:unnamed protein product [Adineta ricciae]|uniref:EGF-like domain-containing protein n=1 Tax=Adineta ricciae TaxID=249248 RepID=A0A814Y356_ADIRI|nr:unnamed protein product [Adineta ricciae]
MPSIYSSNFENDTLPTPYANNNFTTEIDLRFTIPLTFKALTTSTLLRASKDGLSGGAIAGIVIGVITFVIILCALTYYFYKRLKSSERRSPTTAALILNPVSPVVPQASSHPASTAPKSPKSTPTLHCRKPICDAYLKQFNISHQFFKSKHDKCFCKKCHNTSTPNVKCGPWCNGLHGWTCFGLSVNEAHVKPLHIFRDWKTSYYGTTPDRLFSIIRNRFIPLDGDVLQDGIKFRSGHPDTSCWNTSPLLICASQPDFSPSSKFHAPDGNNYKVQVVLQCKQKPDTIIGKADTAPKKDTVWKTQARGAIIPTGLLIRLQKHCNNGRCIEEAQGPRCICDEGFVGSNCDQEGSDFYHRTSLIHGLADPDVLAVNDDLFYLTGTSDAFVLPIYQSTDLINFQLKVTYNPSTIDTIYNYCFIWAPDLSKRGTGYDLYFSAQRVTKGAACPANGQDVTTFLARAIDDKLVFSVPVLVDFGPSAPKGRIAAGCNGDGCLKTVRIDAAVVGPENDRWFFYVWFTAGNNIAAFPFSSPTSIITNAGPASFPIPASDEKINEAPEVFWRNGQYYFFISTAFFDSQYAMFYVMSPTIADLTRKRAVRTHSVAQRNSAGRLVQTHGHNSIVARRGQFFNVFHQGVFDSSGRMIRRDTFKQRIAFRSDGSIHTLNTVNIRWTQLPLYQYSIDIVKKDGSSVGPCIAVGRIGATLETTYTGICPDSGNQLIDKGDIAAFRLFYSMNQVWKDFVEVKYDGVSDQLAIYLSGGITKQIALRWNERVTGTRYSLDIRRKNGTWIAPCVSEAVIGTQIEYVFGGNCPAAKVFVEPRDITSIRICSAINNDWEKAICGSVDYNGNTINVFVRIP